MVGESYEEVGAEDKDAVAEAVDSRVEKMLSERGGGFVIASPWFCG